MLVGLRTIIYPAPRLDESKTWFTRLLGTEPYFDQPFYVGSARLGLEPRAHCSKEGWGRAWIAR